MKHLLLLLSMVVGLVIVALPDSDARLFSISEAHGPSPMDAVGLLITLISYATLVFTVWQRRAKLAVYVQTKAFKAGLFLFGLGSGLIIASVANDFGHWWILGATLLLVFQVPIFFRALRG